MADGRYHGQTVLITGAASGFGSRAAERFAEEGASLILWDLDEHALNAQAASLRGQGHEVLSTAVDVTDENQVKAAIAEARSRFKTLDVAINNAGICHELTPLTAISAETFDRIMAVSARGVFLCMKHQIPWMREKGRGTILNTSSAAGLIGAGMLSAYAAAKHAVIGLTRSAADELASKGIRVNAVCPSFAATPLLDDMAGALAERHGEAVESAHDRLTGRVPMRRVATTNEVVQAMLWICSSENSFMTGQAVSIDGGLTAI